MSLISIAASAACGDEENPGELADVRKLSSSFARGLDIVLRCAREHDLEEYARAKIDRKMLEYSEYFHDETDEWCA